MITVRDIMAPGGALSRALPGFEARPQQVEVSEAVEAAMATPGHLIAEAGTGTGKGFAYLVPAAAQALAHEKRTVVATATIALQGQLMTKDLPLLTSMPEFQHIRYAQAKGASNYACKRRAVDLRDTAQQGSLGLESEKPDFDAGAMLDWIETSETGDREDYPADELGPWEEIATDIDACTKRRCEFYDNCHYIRARQAIKQADIVVANVHLLMADLQLKDQTAWAGGVLPPYDFVVIDEAHNLRDIATSCLGEEITAFAVAQALGRLKGRRRGSGAIEQYVAAVAKGGGKLAPDPDRARELLAAAQEDIYPKIKDARDCLGAFFGMLEGAIRAAAGKDSKIELGEFIKSAAASEFQKGAFMLAGMLRGSASTVADWLPEKGDPSKAEVIAGHERLARIADVLTGFAEGGAGPNWCDWLEVNPRGKVTLQSAPIDVSQILRPLLFDNAEHIQSVIMTSATIAIGDSVEAMAKQVGCNPYASVVVGSPFDYPNNARLIVPFDAEDPKSPRFDLAVAKASAEIARTMGGQTLFLFTSYKAMEAAHTAMRMELAKELRTGAVEIIRQGAGVSKKAMIERMQEKRNVILLGTSSFWEGVDLRGDALKCVVIGKLPFAVPTEPVEMARAKLAKNPFIDIAVPETAIRLKQGFGRLIRSGEDRGTVVIFDTRLINTGYGKKIGRALPPAQTMIVPMADVANPQYLRIGG